MRSIRARWFALLFAALLLAGCAVAPRTTTPSGPVAQTWAGRLSLRVNADQPSSFTAGFDLKGNAQTGQLSLYAPFGTTIAQLVWTPNAARLRSNGSERHFDSLDEMARHATGVEIPVGTLFIWLAGENASAGGWQADLSELDRGRLVARRTSPLPVIELRLVLE